MDNGPIETKNYRKPKKSKKPLVAGIVCFVAGTVFGASTMAVLGVAGSSPGDAVTTTGGIGGIYWDSDLNITLVPNTKPSDHAHLFSKQDIMEMPTCMSTGMARVFCEYCNEEQMMLLPATGHKEAVLEGYPATQWQEGLTDGIYCESCGEIIKDQEIIPVGTPSDKTIFEWKILADDTCSITKLLDCQSDYLIVPEYIDGYRVTNIGSFAFEGWAITHITLPEGVTNIESDAFNGCAYLQQIDLPESVTEIGSKAFANCTSLETINIPSLVKIINSETFIDCSALTIVKIGGYVQNIESAAFYGCSSLAEIGYYEGTVEEWNRIEKAAGWDDSTGDYVVYCTDGTVTGNPFSEGLSYYLSEEGYVISGMGSCTDTHLRIPSVIDGNNIAMIGASAFQDCYDITEVTIGDGINVLGDFIFKRTSINKITIPASVTSIGDYVFDGCGALTEIVYEGTVAEWEKVMKASSWIEGANEYCAVYCTDGIGSKDPSTFRYDAFVDGTCEITGYFGKETIVYIPDEIGGYKVTSIGASTFEGNTDIEIVIIPSGVKSIGANAFKGCTGLTNINIPDSVTDIEYEAFRDCTDLKSVQLGGGIRYLHSYVFAGCTSLTEVNIPDNIINIGTGAFMDCTSLTMVTGGEGITGIKTSAFSGCVNLSYIEIGEKIRSIAEYTFLNCSALKEIRYSGTTSEWDGVEKEAQWNLNADNFVVYCTDGNVEKIFEYTASSDGSCEITKYLGSEPNVVIPEYIDGYKVTSIGKGAFYNCDFIKTVTIPKNVTYIVEQAFQNCFSLTSIIYDGTVSEWNGISKETSWDTSTPDYIIYCTDGSIAKDGTVTYN